MIERIALTGRRGAGLFTLVDDGNCDLMCSYRWHLAYCGTAGKDRRYLGAFADEIEAAKAYDATAREMFGEFARLNFPD